MNQLGIASREERIQALESVLEMPGSVAKHVRVPRYDEMPPGPLATTRLDSELLQMGLATPEQLGAKPAEDEADKPRGMFEEKVWPLTLGEKLRLLFDATFPSVHSLFTTSVWAAGEVLEFNHFNKYITSRGLQKQEGVIFRHLLAADPAGQGVPAVHAARLLCRGVAHGTEGHRRPAHRNLPPGRSDQHRQGAGGIGEKRSLNSDW